MRSSLSEECDVGRLDAGSGAHVMARWRATPRGCIAQCEGSEWALLCTMRVASLLGPLPPAGGT